MLHAVIRPAGLLLLVAAVVLALAHVPGRAAPEAGEIDRLIEQLGSDDAAKRQEAAKRLEEIGEPAVEPLRKAAKSHADPDVRLRAAVTARAIEKKTWGEVRKIDAHKGWVHRVVLTPDGKRAVSAAADGLALWDLETGKEVRRFGENHGW